MNTNLEQVTKLAAELSPPDQLRLVEYLAQRLRRQPPNFPRKSPKDLYGIWRDKFPTDLDVDSTLSEIRTAWRKDFDKIQSHQ